MTFESYYSVIWFLIVLYVVLGNYLYFAKVLPALKSDTGDAAPRFLPSGQFRQVKEYLRLLEREPTRPWFYHFLKNLAAITALLVLAMVPLFLKTFGAF